MNSRDKDVKTGKRLAERSLLCSGRSLEICGGNMVSQRRGEEDEARSHGGFHSTLHPITVFVTLFPKLFTFPSQLYALGGPSLC